MTRRQRIDLSRERRLWITQIAIPTATLLISAYAGIPEFRAKVNKTTTKIKYKFEDTFHKFKRS